MATRRLPSLRHCLSTACAIHMLLAPTISSGAQDEARQTNPRSRPNLVFLYTDDQAQWALGIYGNREIKTPNLDDLARRGTIFRNAFTVTPVCSPSRAACMTSRFPNELGIADWIDPRKEPDLGLSPSAITWPELLKGCGYATMLAGKWHLGTRDEFHPTRQGFDSFFGFRDGSNLPINPRLESGGQVVELKGSLPDLLVNQGLDFIARHREGPFLLSIHFRAPHTPYGPVPEEDAAPYRTLDPAIPVVPGLPRERSQAALSRLLCQRDLGRSQRGPIAREARRVEDRQSNRRDLHKRPRVHDRPARALAQR